MRNKAIPHQKVPNISVIEYIDFDHLVENNLIDMKMGNPCVNHPSDHYSLAYKVQIEYQ